MKFNRPEGLPSKQEFISLLLNACYPELAAEGKVNPTAADYIRCTDSVIKRLRIPCTHGTKEEGYTNVDELGLDTDLFRLMFEANIASEKILGVTTDFIESDDYLYFGRSFERYLNSETAIFRSWIDKNGTASFQTKRTIDLIFFVYVLLTRPECRNTGAEFFGKCLEYLGVTDIESAEKQIMFNFDADGYTMPNYKYPGKNMTFTRKSNTAKNIFVAAVLTFAYLVGRYNSNPEANARYFDKFYEFVEKSFAGHTIAIEMFEAAELSLFSCVKYFEPRSIQVAGTNLYPQNNFVMPDFSKLGTGEYAESPFAAVAAADRSLRILIEAKTGLGKSLYLQTATLGMLKKHCGLSVENEDELDSISKAIGIPEETCVISVPARMFTYCYSHSRYREWTYDLLTLFFNAMWKLKENFFSQQYQKVYTNDAVSGDPSTFEVTDDLREYVRGLAQTGHLVVLLDSFDEIPASLRPFYYKMVSAFVDNYCSYGVGAHIIATSRSMSLLTMQTLTEHLDVAKDNIYCINPLNGAQKAELVRRWSNFFPKNDAEAIIREINRNHYYTEFSENPYMLSLLCAYNGKEIADIISGNLIPTLLDKMVGNHTKDSAVILAVLDRMSDILQVIAIQMLINGRETIERNSLGACILNYIDKTDRTDAAVKSDLDSIIDILVVDVGLIVPADGKDTAYQFINNRILFELAARGLTAKLATAAEKYEQTKNAIFSKIKDVNAFTGLLVPSICLIKTENVRLARDFLTELVMYDFNGDPEKNKVILRALLDLLLNKYGNSIATVATVGTGDKDVIESAQRLLLMRLFSANDFEPTDEEKAEIAASPVYCNNRGWLPDKGIPG